MRTRFYTYIYQLRDEWGGRGSQQKVRIDSSLFDIFSTETHFFLYTGKKLKKKVAEGNPQNNDMLKSAID